MDWLILILSLVAGVVGTGLGGVIGALLKSRGARVMSGVLGFAGGVMSGVVSFEMIPEAICAAAEVGKIAGIFLAVGATVGGMLAIYAVNKLLDLIESKRRRHAGVFAVSQGAGANKIRIFSGIDVSADNGAGQDGSKIGRMSSRAMIKAGTVMLLAIALHNFPEGMAIGASGTLGTETGALIALIIAVHNIPEGMAIAAPLVSGGVSGIKAVILTALAGGATVLGAAVGLAVGELGQIATGVCLSLASGAMLFVTFCELLPQAIFMNGGEAPSVSVLAGLVCSIVFVFVL